MAAVNYDARIKDFLERQKAKSEGTYKARKADLKHFQQWLSQNDYELDAVAPMDIDDYFSDLQKEGYAPNTIAGRWDSVAALFSYLSLHDAIDEDPMDADEIKRRQYLNSKKREHVESDEISYVRKDEVDQLVANAPSPKLRNRLLIRFIFQTGVRANEVARTKIEDIDREERSVEIYDKKTGDKRTVYYQESLDFLLDEWLDGGHRKAFPYASESEYLFVTRRDVKLRDQWVNKIVKAAAENAGIQEVEYVDKGGNERCRITAHALRHGHGVYSLKCGIDMRRIQKHMGHESLDMTLRYLQVIDKDVRDAYRENWGHQQR